MIVEFDCQTTLQLIVEGVSNTHRYTPLIDHIRVLKDNNQSLSFSHTLREGNFCADCLAKKEASSSSPRGRYDLIAPSNLNSPPHRFHGS